MNLLKEAIKEAKNVKSGQEFYVKDLFKGHNWKQFPVTDRINLGRDFLRTELNTLLDTEIIALGKNSANQQKYKKL